MRREVAVWWAALGAVYSSELEITWNYELHVNLL